jgi:hypothetical protein
VIEPTSDQQTRNPRAVVWKDVLGPGPVLTIAITVFILTACAAPGEWVTNAAISWLVTTVAVACALLLAARPLTPLRERSHLVGRLGWLVSFMLAAVLLCLSAFVGAIAGAQVRIDQTGLQLGHLGALLRSVLSIAIGGGLFLFFVWLAADVWRLGPDGRLAAIVRGARFVARPWPVPPANQYIRKWILALTSPFWLTIALVGSAAWEASVFFQQGGLTIG